MAGLSKSRIVYHRQCPKRLWLSVNQPELAQVDDATHRIFGVGDDVGVKARELFPDGILINPTELKDALEMTNRLLPQHKPLFEATFEHEGTLVRADLLLPDTDGWRMIEVKSSTSVKEHYLQDIAIQTYVLQQNGVKLTRVELAHLNNQFVYQGDGNYQGLLTFADVTEKAFALAEAVPQWIAAAQQTLTLDHAPDIVPAEQCTSPHECQFRQHCQPEAFIPVEVHSPSVLPRKDKWAKQLIATGVNDLRTIDLNSFSNEVYQRIGRSLQAGQFQLEANAKKIVSQLPYPYYFMDFETVNPAIPVWAGTRPYQQVPFQWSCHIQAENGVMRHEAYLSDAHSDPRLAFTESLIALLGNTTGTIFVYHAPFEKSHLREMAQVFPQYHDQIQGMIARIFDLLPLMRNHYYHPNMRGSWSIKAVLPTIADDLDYQQLMVSHGGDAMEAFNEMMQLSTSSERYHALKQGLLDYCKLDTLAMVRLVDFVMNKG